ncbi:MAG: hypothetical protein M3Y24_01020 [Acidobacteriota bacterium]|nr:hypothetical protein [Acidobacteriota bacterium]
MIIAAAVAIVLATLYFTLAIREKDVPEPIPISPIQHLEDRKQAIYDNLRDLQFEYRLGKLSDGDYQQNKLALQRELAGVLAETEETVQQLGLIPAKSSAKSPAKRPAGPPASYVCAHCGAKFSQALKFCGECGKEMA